MGNILKGNLRMLNRARATKAFWESRMFASSTRTNVAKETRDTTKGAHDQMNEVPADK